MTDYSFWLGEESDDLRSFPYSTKARVTFDFGEYGEGLPDEELTEVVFEADFSIHKLPEECPEMIVFDEADYEE